MSNWSYMKDKKTKHITPFSVTAYPALEVTGVNPSALSHSVNDMSGREVVK